MTNKTFQVVRMGKFFEVQTNDNVIIAKMIGGYIKGKPIKVIIKNDAIRNDDRTICIYREYAIKMCLRKFHCDQITQMKILLDHEQRLNNVSMTVMRGRVTKAIEHLKRMNVDPKLKDSEFIKYKI